jgi:hypothetical protein
VQRYDRWYGRQVQANYNIATTTGNPIPLRPLPRIEGSARIGPEM